MTELAVRFLREGDFASWNTLWQGYLHFYREEVEEEVTKETFSRLVGSREDMFGLVAEAPDGEVVGIANAVVHPSTWSMKTTCYLEDLFVSPATRGLGAAASLIAELKQEARRRGADKVYWHTQQFNAPARSLYDQVADLTSYAVYERAL